MGKRKDRGQLVSGHDFVDIRRRQQMGLLEA